MRTALIIDDALLERARELTGMQEKTALVRAGLEGLIAREAGKRLAHSAHSAENLKHPATAPYLWPHVLLTPK